MFLIRPDVQNVYHFDWLLNNYIYWFVCLFTNWCWFEYWWVVDDQDAIIFIYILLLHIVIQSGPMKNLNKDKFSVITWTSYDMTFTNEIISNTLKFIWIHFNHLNQGELLLLICFKLSHWALKIYEIIGPCFEFEILSVPPC